MLNFESDYNNGCLPEILDALVKTNSSLQTGYGFDDFTASAGEKIRAACAAPDADIYFIAGGTQTNLTVISALLDDTEGVVAASTGHIGAHEAGAIEYTGHKVMPLPAYDGKMHADDLKNLISTFYSDGNFEHMTFPGMVYISFPTELGTLYTRKELTDIYSVCSEYGIPLYIDGARLGYGLMSTGCDVTLPELARLCDAFYIGGTKAGALCGEALVFTKGKTPFRFFTKIKQHGALLAKGRLCGVQFDTLFTDGLYLRAAKNAIDRAEELKQVLKDRGYTFFLETDTNQQFVIVDNEKMKALSEKVRFSFWERYDDTRTVIRFCTSWATTPESIEELKNVL